jgi:excisionase family DNA binding protein
MAHKSDRVPRLGSLENVRWVAHYLGVSRNTIHQWVLEGHIPYINLGVTGGRRIIRFDPAAIEEWLLKRSFMPDQAQPAALTPREEIDQDESPDETAPEDPATDLEDQVH